MSEFDVIECGFNVADETINFVPRMLADGDQLFEGSTLATIKQSEVDQKLSDLNISAYSFKNKLYYTINKSIGIFADLSCTELFFNYSFDEYIDVFHITPDSRYLFICLRDGTISYIDVEGQEVIVNEQISTNNCSEECHFIKCFLEEYISNQVKFIVITKDGCIYRIIFENMNHETYTCSKNLVKDVQFKVNTTALIYPVLFLDGEQMAIYNLETDDAVHDESLNLLKIYPCGQEMFIGLDVEGNLARICARTSLVFYINNSIKFKDFAYTVFPLGEGITKKTCLCLSTENDIQFYDSYSDLINLKFSLKVPNNVQLIIPGSIDEDCMFISIMEKHNVVQELRILVIYETAPESRLKTLLRRQMFDDAERFATLFNLSNVEVLKAKAQVIVDKRVCHEEDVRNLLSILNKINDTAFTLQSCFDSYQSCEKLSDARELLNYACNNVVTKNMSGEILEMYNKMLDVMNQLDIFVLIQRTENSYCSNWQKFVECNPIDLLCEYLQRWNIDAAIVLYIQLNKQSKSQLNERTIETILNIFDNLPVDIYQPFLYCFIPISLYYLPTTLPLFVKWLKRKVFFIEQSDPIRFPQNAIDFTTSTLELMKADTDNINFQQQNTLHKESINDLSTLIKALKTIQLLKDNYEIKVALKEFLKGPKSVIEILLTFDLDEEHFDQFLKNFLCRFMLENNLEPNTIFLDVIHNQLQYEESYWVKVVPSILRNINVVKIKLTAIISLLEVASVPWSRAIRDIARSALKYRHQLVETIKKQIKHEPLYAILMKKSYNLQDVVINSFWDIEYSISRIIYCNESTMVDDIYQLCLTSKDRHTANILLIKHFIKIRDYQRALEILDNNSPQDIKQICQSIIHIIKINDKMNLPDQNEPYLEILQCLQRRLQNSEECNESFHLIRNISACSEIRTTLYDKININDLECPRKKKALLDTLLYNIHQDIADGTTTAHEALDRCKKIACLLNESRHIIILRFCELHMDSWEVIEECVDYVYRNEETSKNLCLMAIIILKSIGLSASPDLLNFTIGLNVTISEPLNNVQNQIKCLEIAHRLVAKALLYAERHEINACVEVFNWVMSTCFMTWKNSSIQKDYFPHIHVPQITFPSMGSLNCVKFVFNAYTCFSVTDCCKDTRYLTHFDDEDSNISEDEFACKIQQLPMMIQNFCLEGQTLTALKLITTLKRYLCSNKTVNTNILNTINKTIKHCNTQLLQKNFGANVIDTELAYSLLTSSSVRESISIINRQLQVYKRKTDVLKALAQIALRLLNYHQVIANRDFYIDLVRRSNLWDRILDCQINMKTFFTSSREQLLDSLIHHEHVDLEMLNEYCKNYEMDIEHYYHVYLKKILLNWKPEYDQIEDAYGKICINMKSEDTELLQKCREVESLTRNKEALYNFINNFKHEVNFYHYEVFFVIFTILSNSCKNEDYSKRICLLHFLKRYIRINKPSDNEIEEWYSLFPDSQIIDPLSQWRLPFTASLFTVDIWKIIRPELSLDTYRIWFEVISILEKILNKNEICSFVIKQIISSGILQQSNKDWVLYPIHDYLFEQVDVCVQEMTNLEMATSAIYQLVMHTPKGADQVNAAKLCLKYAIQYKESGPEYDPAILKAFTKVQKKYLSFAANHILHLCQIDSEKYVHLLLDSTELIEALYMNESILERADRVLLKSPDINKAVDELGVLFDINILSIRLKLLENWLSEKVVSNYDLTISNNSNELDMIPAANLKRATYICQSGDITKWQKHLLKIGYQETQPRNNYYMANALNCLIIISDVETIEALVGVSVEELRNYVNKLYLLSDLEYLGLNMDVETLDKYKKANLLRRLAQDISNPATIKIMAALCVTYNEYDMKFWQLIITSCIKLNLIQLLKNYVIFLKDKPFFRYKEFYIAAWQTIIDQSFDITNANDKYVYDTCVRNIRMIESCPTLLSLKLYNVFNKCCNFGMYEFAAIITQYLPIEEQETYIEKISSIPNLSVNIRRLSKFGIWGTEQVQKRMGNC